MATKKTFIIEFTSRSGKSRYRQGTVSDFVNYASYTLECGNSYDRKISRNPKTIDSFVRNYNRAIDETQGGYNRTYCNLHEGPLPEGVVVQDAS
jgi:hypothetical protein